MKIEEIMNKAHSLGACDKSGSVSGWKSLAWLFFSPQGEEFCIEHNFPSLAEFRSLDTDLEEYNIYVSSGIVVKDNTKNIALIGNTHGVLYFDDNTCVHKVILMHGASAELKVRNYSVVRLVDNDMKAKIDKDETSVILY